MTTLRFAMLRNRDRDVVADGVRFADGVVVVRWRGEYASTVVYHDWESLMRVSHIGEPGHENWTTASWLDGVCWTCGTPAGGALYGGNGGQCRACSSTWDGPPSINTEPENGSWRQMK